jgi:hypothetical protein
MKYNLRNKAHGVDSDSGSRKTTLPTASLVFLLALPLLLGSCEAIGGIFKAGMGFGIFLVIAVVIAIVVLFMRMGKNKNP